MKHPLLYVVTQQYDNLDVPSDLLKKINSTR